MPGVVFTGHAGGAELHVTEPVQSPGSVAIGSHVGEHVLAEHAVPLHAGAVQTSSHCMPGAHVVFEHELPSGTQVAVQVWQTPASGLGSQAVSVHCSSQCEPAAQSTAEHASGVPGSGKHALNWCEPAPVSVGTEYADAH